MQFNNVHLYNSEFTHFNSVGKNRGEQIHARIRIRCSADSSSAFDIEAYDDDELLDKDLRCKPCDVCEDKIDGFRHNYIIDVDVGPLNEDQFYICNNNKSTIAICEHDTAFSNYQKTCISKSKCFQQGRKQFYIDEYNYIQCKDDESTNVYFRDGVIKDEETGAYSCQ